MNAHAAHRVGISLHRLATGVYEARNARGGSIMLSTGGSADFTPTELLLTAIAGCAAIDIDLITGRRAEPEEFSAVSGGTVTKGEGGNILNDIEVTYTVRFPEGEAGDRAREMLPVATQQSHDRLCTVGRTVERGTPVGLQLAGESTT